MYVNVYACVYTRINMYSTYVYAYVYVYVYVYGRRPAAGSWRQPEPVAGGFWPGTSGRWLADTAISVVEIG